MKIKYIRVSTQHQNTQRQEQDAAGYDKVFIDKQSGKDTNRPAFKQMMEFVREGDMVVFESFSRISRSLPDLLNTLDEFERKKVNWRSEKEQLDTSGATGRLIVSIMGAISAYEREINAERREYGYNKAKAEGRVGRPAAQLTPQFVAAYNAWKAGEITAVKAMKQADMSKSVWYRKVAEYEGQQ